MIKKLIDYIKENENIENYFYNGLNEKTQEEKLKYIMNHFTYYTMNSWNINKSIANNVKVHRIGLSNEMYIKFFDLLEVDSDYIYFLLKELIEDFEIISYTKIFFNGRSSGYLVMTSNGSPRTNILEMYELDELQYYDTLKEFKNDHSITSKDISECYLLLKAFDKLCDVLRNELKYIVENAKIEQEIVTIQKVVKSIVI